MSDNFTAELLRPGAEPTASGFKFNPAHVDTVTMRAAPIRPAWIIEGNPVARVAPLARASDTFASTAVWDCTAGRFRWYYGGDEAVYILQGSVEIVSPDGSTRVLRPGDTAYFPAGHWFEWHVENYVRKVAFCHDVMPPLLRLQMKVLRKFRLVGRKLFGDVGEPPRPSI